MNHLACGLMLGMAVLSGGQLGLLEFDMIGLDWGNPVAVEQLRCEYLADPMGIDVPKPRLSWVLRSAKRGQRQTAYQILVASHPRDLARNAADLWDSGRIESDQSVHVEYAGKPLQSRQRCYWKVRVWDKDRKPSAFSRVAAWEMSLLDKDDWRAKWISAPPPRSDAPQPSPHFRRGFDARPTLVRARAYVCGLGYYELYVNGTRVGDRILDPAFTRYDKRVLYATYDVTKLIRSGANAVGAIVGNGWYNMHTRAVWDFDKAPWRQRPALLCQVELTYADGSSQVIASDGSWKVSTGAILFESIRNGETYDARLERPGWCTNRYNDTSWPDALEVEGPKGVLRAQMCQPIKAVKTVRPIRITEPKPRVYVFDMGQNMAGWARLRVSGSGGTRVVMKYGERLNSDGTVDQQNIAQHVKQWPFQTDTYTLKGRGLEVWEPRFAYHGFQYVEVAGLPARPNLGTVTGVVVHTAFDSAGQFQCSNPLFNQIQQNTLWSYVGNFHGYPTDCPHREKNGWTGDAHLAAETGLYNFTSAPAYTKWINDLRDEQRESGELPGIVPTGGWGYHWGNGPAWDSAYVLIPWYLYQYRGDVQVLAEHYDRLKRYVDYLTSKAQDHIVSIGLGDWVPAKTKTPEAVTSTGYYYRDALIVARIAEILGRDKDAHTYTALALKIKDVFHRRFYEAKTGLYAGGTQTAMSCALYHGLVGPDQRQRVVENLVANIEAQQGHLDAGILGTKYLIDALTQNGRADVVFTMVTKTDYPSWGHWIRQGATTLWEQWDGGASRNHIMFGHISAWFYQALAGINPDPAGPGFKRIIIKPRLVENLDWARADHRSMYGTIESSWRKRGRGLALNVTIPVNTRATVYIPAASAESVTESGRRADRAPGVRRIGRAEGCAVYAVESGSYRFRSVLAD